MTWRILCKQLAGRLSPRLSPRQIWNNLRDLEAKRERLIKELEQVNQEIADVDNKLSQLSMALQQLEAEKQEQARQTYQLHKCIKPIPGSAEADNKEIQDADDIRLRAISVIQNALGSL